MQVRVNLFPGAIQALSQAQQRAAIMTAEQMLHEKVTDAQIPFDEGTLQNIATRVDTTATRRGTIKIVHDVPYASRLYFHPEFNFQKTTNANARAYWWEDWLTGPKATRASRLFKEFYRRIAGGYVQ